ncbi:MAG: ADP-ribosyl-[dinitrogen reductase] hydrolase [Gammaproteobacteria bacterium]|nr:ADP-ribosyl-[dinitrogen reductase] hydrolase [Gammaproteobacteria bacterium]
MAGPWAGPRSRPVNRLRGLAVGDALGATTEFLTPREIRQYHKVHRDIVGGGWLHLAPGAVTDDTEMSLALGRSIIDRRRVDAVSIAEAFSAWMRSKPVDIGNTVRRGIVHYRSTGRPKIDQNEQSAGNGACMRCLPVALAYCRAPVEQLVSAVHVQSHVTHNAPLSDAGTDTVVKMVVAALQGGGRRSMRQIADALVSGFPAFRYDGRRVENPSGWIVDTLRAVFQALFSTSGFEEALVDVVNRGGDSDTTGAIAGMLAGALYGREAIPLRWSNALDTAVRQECEQQAISLVALANGGVQPVIEGTGISNHG